VHLVMAELLIGSTQIRTRPGAEVGPGCVEQPLLERNDGLVVDCALRKGAHLPVTRPQQLILDQPVWTDKQFVPGEGGQGLIRRVAVSRGAQRQRLPPSLAGLVKTVDPGYGGRSHIADAVGRGQRGDVQQQARGTVCRRERWKTQWQSVVAHGCPSASPRLGREEFSAVFTIISASLTIAFR